MESNQLNNTTNEDAVIEALTLTCEIDKYGTKIYRNKKGDIHRIHGPAISWPSGAKFWFKNGLYHREDGPAITYSYGREEYYINGYELSERQFIQWQKKNGIKPIE